MPGRRPKPVCLPYRIVQHPVAVPHLNGSPAPDRYKPVPGAAVAPRHNSKAVWAEQFNNLALAEQQTRVQQQTKEDVSRAADFVKGQIEDAKTMIKNIPDKKKRENARKSWNKAIKPFRDHYAEVRCVAAQLPA